MYTVFNFRIVNPSCNSFFAMGTVYDNLVKVDRRYESISSFWGLSNDDVSSCSSSGSGLRRRSSSLSDSLAQPFILSEEVC